MKINERSLAARYAKAYDGLAKTNKEAQDNLAAYTAALDNLKQAGEYINNPTLPFKVKSEILNKALPKGAALNFISLLVQAKRFGLRDIILSEIQHLSDARQGIKRAQIISAAPLKDTAALTAALSKYFNSKLEVNFTQDATLLAGVIIKQGDVQIDASALGRINNLQKSILEG